MEEYIEKSVIVGFVVLAIFTWKLFRSLGEKYGWWWGLDKSPQN